ncbi:hypothetical protein NH514_15240 [Pseudoalteromonas sp. ACER1]|jgi:hypothetical protein|uniref:hypothetical protein n=1 Tax=unclassified Pseudoalteromonas TaxID=194690 RepID=UPI001F27EE5D|nr:MULTISPECIES: hypothetical protein [unclassified Pseudoalteromonas]MCF2849851.1 hypothetical protein [Pseudoalteromonas sp. PAST1]MCF2918711.1 hypothetical protein [Pseudoalteromonas sp. Cn5-37]MCO7212085.1 hypothetical protein [Pseudoalteromonas sp. ACER1]MCP4588642.1 hypothetical protein [Pseudoalteromonas sp.]
MNSSSKRGRPARQMSEDKIINMLEDIYLNKEYFEKLFIVLESEEEKFFTDFFENFHEKIAETTVKKSKFLISSSEAESRIIELKGSNLNESEIKKRIKDVEAKVAVFEDEDINEFQSVIDKLPDELWIRYNNRLRQQAYKKNNRWSRQIEFSEDAYLDLKVLKNSLNAKTWNDLSLQLKRDYLQIENICAALQVDNLNEALLKIKENKLLMSNK